jgi:uncharacterized protein HemY
MVLRLLFVVAAGKTKAQSILHQASHVALIDVKNFNLEHVLSAFYPSVLVTLTWIFWCSRN